MDGLSLVALDKLKAWRFVRAGRLDAGRGDQIWLKPSADVGDISSIWGYAFPVDGYRYAKTNLGVECGDLANQKLEIFERSGIWQGSFEELGCCLFFEQRRWRHFGTDPVGDQLMGLQAL